MLEIRTLKLCSKDCGRHCLCSPSLFELVKGKFEVRIMEEQCYVVRNSLQLYTLKIVGQAWRGGCARFGGVRQQLRAATPEQLWSRQTATVMTTRSNAMRCVSLEVHLAVVQWLCSRQASTSLSMPPKRNLITQCLHCLPSRTQLQPKMMKTDLLTFSLVYRSSDRNDQSPSRNLSSAHPIECRVDPAKSPIRELDIWQRDGLIP